MRHFLRCSAYAFPCRPLAARWQRSKVPWVASRAALRHAARSAFTASAPEPCERARTAPYAMILLSLACVGLGVLDAAIPSPKDGCMTRNGARTVPTPKSRADDKVG